MKRIFLAAFSGILLFTACGLAASVSPLESQVRHRLVMLSRYGVFDDIAFQVSGRTVTLTGQVAEPVLKDDAARTLTKIEGVEKVVNNIEVLPLSPFDDRLRLAVYRAVYSDPNFSTRYGLSSVPSVHIIVKNGNVELEGVVANQFDRTLAGMRANGVSGAFSVINDLRIEN